VEHRGYAVTSLVQTVIDCVVRLELPAALAIVDEVLGSRREKGEGLTRRELEEAAAILPSAAKRRRVLELLALADETAESVGESRSRALIHMLGLESGNQPRAAKTEARRSRDHGAKIPAAWPSPPALPEVPTT
jgi:hypothetical protein